MENSAAETALQDGQSAVISADEYLCGCSFFQVLFWLVGAFVTFVTFGTVRLQEKGSG